MTQQIPGTARCHNCRYLLRGLPNPICPECGHPFDPDDPNSYYDPANRKPSILQRFVQNLISKGPYRPGDVVGLVLITAVVISKYSTIKLAMLWPLAGCFFFGVPFDYIFVGLLFLDLLLRWGILIRAKRTNDDGILQEFKNGRRRWRLAIVLIVVSCVTVVYPWPAYLRFYASMPSLQREAKAILAGDAKSIPWRRIGLYDVEAFYSMHKGIVFVQVGHDYNRRYGFAYRPKGPPPWKDRYGMNNIRWRPVTPNWYMEAW